MLKSKIQTEHMLIRSHPLTKVEKIIPNRPYEKKKINSPRQIILIPSWEWHHKKHLNSTYLWTNSNKNVMALYLNQTHSRHKITNMTNPKIKTDPTIYNSLIILLSRSTQFMRANYTLSSLITCQIIPSNIPKIWNLEKWNTGNIRKRGEMG